MYMFGDFVPNQWNHSVASSRFLKWYVSDVLDPMRVVGVTETVLIAHASVPIVCVDMS